MAIKRVILTGLDENDNEVNIDWAFNDSGAQLVDTKQAGQLEINDGNADGYQYLGIAAPGTATSAASWQIRRWNTSGDPVVTEWADGDNSTDNVFDNRTSLSYS